MMAEEIAKFIEDNAELCQACGATQAELAAALLCLMRPDEFDMEQFRGTEEVLRNIIEKGKTNESTFYQATVGGSDPAGDQAGGEPDVVDEA